MVNRQISEIATEIKSNWKNAPKGAREYIKMMLYVDHIDDNYLDDYETGLNRLPSYFGHSDARSIVTNVLGWIEHNWRGEKARKIKTELETILKER